MLQQAAAMGERSQFSPSRLKMPTLIVLSGKVDQKEYVLTNKLTVIGSSPMATVHLRGWFKPKVAAQINQRDDGYYLGTGSKIPSVNGAPIQGPADELHFPRIALEGMATASQDGAPSGGSLRVRALLADWWQHRASFLISLGITVAALGIYLFTFLGDRSTTLFDFLKRFEYNTLDTRFRYRPARYTPPDPRIVVVSVDQQSQEVLGKWPFPRKYFGQMLDALHQDGAKVAAFDITFDKPDQTSAPIRALWARLEQEKKSGQMPDRKLEAHVAELAAEFDSDAQFAAALRRFGPVVFGNFYLEPQEVRGIDYVVIDKNSEMVQW